MPIRRFEAPPFSDPRAKMEKIFKPLESYQQRRDQALAALRSPPDVEEESRFCWGGPGQFTFNDVPSISFTIKDPKDKDKDKDKDDADPGEGGEDDGKNVDPDKTTTSGKVLTWSEQARETEEIRVENPDDSSQYVIVERIKSIYFKPPGDEIAIWPKHPHKFELKNPEPKSKNPPRQVSPEPNVILPQPPPPEP